MAPRRGRRNGVNPSRQDEAENRRNDRAWLAVKAFNELKPTLTSFARAVTGRSDVQVRAAKMTCTNGKYIDIVPPIALGDRIDHDKSMCDKRDRETMMKLCQACATREMLMGRLFHEIAHIAFDSFSPVLKFDREKMHALVDEWHPKDACNHGANLHSQIDKLRTHNEMTSLFSPFLYFLLVAYDDARVDGKMYRARPGLKVPTEARLRVVFTRGIEKADGSIVMWSDSPLNAQVTIGLRMLASGLDLRPGYLSDDALRALEDPELIRISDQAEHANSVSNSFDIALAAFRRLQDMGLCYVPKCVPTPSLDAEPDDKDEKGKDDSDSGNQGGTGNSPGDPEAEESETPENDSDPGDDDSGASDNSGDGGSSSAGDDDRQDAGDEPSQGDGDSDFENEDSRGDGQDQEGEPGDDESDDREVRDDDERSESPEQSDGEGDDDPADRHDDGDGGDSPEPEPGDQGEEPGGVGEGDDEDPSGSDDAEASGASDDGAGESDDDGSDRVSGADAQGAGAGGADPGSDNRDDPEAPAEQDVEEADRSDDDGDGESDGDIELSDAPVESPEDDGDDAEAQTGPLGEDVWQEDNPESEVIPPEVQGTPEDVGEMLEKFLGHGHEDELDAELLGEPIPDEQDSQMETTAVATAVGQEAVFDTSSRTVRGVQVLQYPHEPFSWGSKRGDSYYSPSDFMPSETIVGKALVQARIVFSENKRAKTQGNLKSGRINTRVLGRRAALGDDRLFKKKTLPGKRDYFVVITADCSGSTNSSHRNERIKRAVFAKAELLNRLGIPFAIYGHTGGEGDVNVGWWSDNPANDGMTEVWMMQIKGADEPWNDSTKQRLADMPPVAENLDGHTLEFCRKVAMKSQATDRIIIYYTDGAMPAANYDEELVILESEIEKCKRNNITLMAVGINTDSPERYGFDTVRVDSDEDLSLVVDRLKARLTN